MWLYLIIFAIPFIAYIQGKDVNRNKTFLMLYTAFLALFVGMSDMFGGYDRYIYGEVFDSLADAITAGESPFNTGAFLLYETGYSLLSTLIALVTENRYIFILVLTLIIYFNIYKVFERHFTNYPLAFMIFLGMIFFFTFTYLRQVVAFSFAWLSIKYLLDGKRTQFFIMIIITAMMHKSGVVFAILWFMPIKKWKRNQVIWILIGCGLVGLSGITSGLYDVVLSSGIVADQGNDYNTDNSARIAYVLEVVFFGWIILKNYDRIENNRQNAIFLNMAWMFCAFLLLFVRSSDGGRVAWFFTIGIVYTITLIATTNQANGLRLARNKVAPLMIVVMLTMYVRVYNNWQLYNNLYPYKTFLTDGHRTPDYTYERYEYDENYDRDKFYRPAFRFLKK